MPSLRERVEKELLRVTTLRHKLHEIPELCFEEHKTADFIRGELMTLGIDFIDGIDNCETATIAHVGPATNPCIALRADIDGLPITERIDRPYRSKHDGRMHACGHDGHTATLLGTAAILKQIERDLSFCVKLIFQPAEEGGGGGERLMKAGLAEGKLGPKPEAIFGLHGWPNLPTGRVSSKAGPLLAATDQFYINLVGKGTHGAMPHTGRDPVVAAAELVSNLQQVASRDFDPTEPVVVTVGKLHGGTAVNVIPDEALIAGTARTLSEPARKLVREALERRTHGVAAANGCNADFDWRVGYPPLINDPTAFNYVVRQARHALGNNAFIPAAKPAMGGEDFSYYLKKIPGCFFLVGLQHGSEPMPQLHSDRFDFTDMALGTGMMMFLHLVQNFGSWRDPNAR
ncbi:MAG: M20 family metallopeptidase [Planctomycetota bacterium]